MPVYSMTGFANASEAPGAGASPAPADAAKSANLAANLAASIHVDIRSVNSRFLDLSLRLPDEWRELEPQLRELVVAAFKRGKIELRLSSSASADDAWPQPQPEQLNRLSRLESSVQSWLPQARPFSVNEALAWCRQATVGGNAGGGRPNEAALAAAQTAVRGAIAGLREARAREGARLVDILAERIARLRELADQAAPLVPAVVARQQQRFIERWNDAITQAGGNAVSADAQKDRALNEAAAYAIRIDVAEELGRLNAHLDEISRLLTSGGELGKRLDFLIQELQREANTLGSKSAALELTQVSVEMKVAIEQMREQVQNIE